MWRNTLGLAFLAGTGAITWWTAIWGWRTDRRRAPVAPGPGAGARTVLAQHLNRRQLAVALAVTDAFGCMLAITIADLPGITPAGLGIANQTANATGLALLPLLLLCYTTERFRQPAFLVPPWGREPDRTNTTEPATTTRDPSTRKTPGMRFTQTLLGITVALAMVIIAFGIIYLLASHHADRFWGLFAAVLAGAYIVWALRTSSRLR